MMRTVVFNAEARQDLIEIWNYISKDSVSAADRVQLKVRAAAEKLAESPGLGHSRRDVRDQRYRFWRVYSYLIVYRYDDSTLNVVRIVHGARNIRRLLNRPAGG